MIVCAISQTRGSIRRYLCLPRMTFKAKDIRSAERTRLRSLDPAVPVRISRHVTERQGLELPLKSRRTDRSDEQSMRLVGLRFIFDAYFAHASLFVHDQNGLYLYRRRACSQQRRRIDWRCALA